VPNTVEIGPHGGGHFTINGDPGGDFFTSPGDPAFYLHHGQVDRMWAYWQALDPKKRQNALTGTRTFFNNPPSPNTTLDEMMEYGDAGPSIRLGDVMSTTSGPLCYIYI
jgi:tyrosinase